MEGQRLLPPICKDITLTILELVETHDAGAGGKADAEAHYDRWS